MLLTIDVGNLNVKVGLFDDSRLLETWRLAPDPRRTGDEYGLLLLGLLSRQPGSLSGLSGVAISSVVPRMDLLLEEACRRHLGLSPLILGPDVDMGMPNLTDYPEQVGTDRLAGAYAGLRLYGAPLLTLHLGTATVINVISDDGAFRGGAIAPGPDAMLQGLVEKATKLPPIPLKLPASALGRNTQAAMQAGILFGFVSMVEGLVRRFWSEFGRWQVVATGGYSELLAGSTDIVDRVDPDLTLQGLRLLYDLNAARRKK
ncbi:MAG: type III pantothenate kinase [Chloroflexi bacterium]|nr:type III pantothenate kinase [Chloroflexota bacterium]MCL5109084.1 type III pantothenate kinase [Chloroflexota bacterium]